MSRVTSVVQPSEVPAEDPKAGSRKGSRKSSKNSQDSNKARGSNEKDVPGSSTPESFGGNRCLASRCCKMVYDMFIVLY